MLSSYRFDNVELRPSARQLLVSGAEAHVGGRAFDMLVALVERQGRVVSKDELLDLVWPGLVVEENNLQAQMSQLRKLIGPRAVTTIPGRGYRFDAAVDRVEGGSGPAPTAPAGATPGGAPRASAGWAAVPRPAAAIVGRELAIDALAPLCEAHPLVTLVGAGGIGKTRLAQALAQQQRERRPDRPIAWVDLAVVSDPALVPAAIAAALGVTLVPRVDAFETMGAVLRGRPLVVLVDNAEHLVDAVANAVLRLLDAGPELHCLVTSQQPLKLAAEQICRVAPLDVPAWPCSLEVAAASGAVALFVQRAMAADRRFRLGPDNAAGVVRICRCLDGMPLAIELAAVRVPLLGVRGVLDHLDARFELLTGGERNAPTRQQTLRAALDWSFDLLDDRERAVLRRAAVFVGGFDLDAAKAVLADDPAEPWTMLDALGGLVDRSFVDAGDGAQPRYAMAETTRSYALARLRESGELEALRRCHAQAMCDRVDSAWRDYWTTGDEAFVQRYAPELDNFRAAMDWAREREPYWYVAMTAASIPLLRHVSLIREGVASLGVAASLVDDAMPLAVRARLAMSQAMLGGGRGAAERSVELHRELGDAFGLYLSAYWMASRNDVDEATIEAMVDIKRRLEDPRWPAKALAIGRAIEEELLYQRGRYAEAVASLDVRVALCEAAGLRDGATSALMFRSIATFGAGDPKSALAQSKEILARCTALGNHYRLACEQAYAFTLTLLVHSQSRLDEADRLSRTFADLDRRLGWAHIADAADGWSVLAGLGGRIDAAARLAGFSDHAHRSGELARDPIAAAARDRAAGLLAAGLAPERRAELEREGRSLTPDAAAALALPGWQP